MSETNPKLDAYFSKLKAWREESMLLREIALDCGLDEDMKWGQPCYTLENKNVVLIHGFKEYCALLFFKGALMKDEKGLLIQQTENVQAGRQIRFSGVREIVKLKTVLKAYVRDAIAVEKAGLKVEHKKTTEFAVAAEFQMRMDELPALREAFEALTPGRQRGYLLYFSSAKQSRTREARVEKCVERILDGLGLDD
ncbi:MAG: YdeI/OmpD-associated family protein [Burkholderiaceae bacterium]|nr:YdeI/OmpD-associated family protein [Burkholderiaceae bacterium]